MPDSANEPTLAEQARTVVHRNRFATLSTQSAQMEGYPFCSLVAYGSRHGSDITLLLSQLAVHSQNLAREPRCSLLVDPSRRLAEARVTLLGDLHQIADTSGVLRTDYLRAHPEAEQWIGFGDFHLYRLDLQRVYFVAGFGRMGWISADDYGRAQPDPLADYADGILSHMNQDHADALPLYCRAFAQTDAAAATMVHVDRLGMAIDADVAGGTRRLRIGFPRPAETTDEVRRVLIEMLTSARQSAGASKP